MILFLFFSLSMTYLTKAQGLHFSQFNFAPAQLSPALTGVFPEDLRFIANYRRQWKSVPVDYLTFSGGVDGKLTRWSNENGFFSAGLNFNYDVAGDGNLTYSQMGFSVAYTQQLSEEQLITGGISMGGGQRRFNLNNLNFGNQFNGDVYVSTADSREVLEESTSIYLDIGAGFNYHLQNEDRLYWADFGLGIFHLTQPDVSFYNQKTTELPRRVSIYGIGGFKVAPKWDIHLIASFQKQSAYTEAIGGTALEYQLTDTRGKELAIRLGTSFRFVGARDALIPNIAVTYNNWLLGFSYDNNLSDFEIATNGKGGPELALQHTITKVKPVKAAKACPIF